MKYKAIAAFVGAALVMTAVTGCSTQQTDEPETLVISDMELIEETDGETVQDETQELAIDLSDELETQAQQAALPLGETETESETERETELQTETSAAVTAQKPGEEETEETDQQSESEAAEEATEQGTEAETRKGKDKKPKPSRNKDKKPSAPVKPETDDTQKSSEAQGVSDMQDASGEQGVSDMQDASEAQGASGNTETTDAPQSSEAPGAAQIPGISENTEATEATEAEESELNASNEDEQSESAESEIETEMESETAEGATEAESEPGAELETVESESEPEAESETAESETETETGTDERESEAEIESENAGFEQGLCFVNDRVNVRKSASEDAEILALLTPGMSVLALAEEGDWTQIRYEGADGFAEGYVKSEFLSGAEDLRVAKENINVRAEASTDSEKLGKFVGGETVLVVEEEGEWSKIRFTTSEGTVDAYVKTEFLETAEATDEGKLERLMNAEVEAESEIETEAEPELGSEVETETESETESETETIGESESETEAVTESETETEAESGRESENATETEIETEAKAESETEIKTETESESESETEIETETETESEPESETETESESESETEAVTESETENESEMTTEAETAASAVELSDGAQAQFELAKTLFPQMQTAGIIYSEGNAEAEVLIEEYTKLAAEYDLELVTDTIEEEIDIDFAASEMVGNVDGIFCISDEMVDGLVQTIRAYADEVGIPVIGADETHVEQGCVAAYEGGTLYWNTEEAGKLGIDHTAISADEVREM